MSTKETPRDQDVRRSRGYGQRKRRLLGIRHHLIPESQWTSWEGHGKGESQAGQRKDQHTEGLLSSPAYLELSKMGHAAPGLRLAHTSPELHVGRDFLTCSQKVFLEGWVVARWWARASHA